MGRAAGTGCAAETDALRAAGRWPHRTRSPARSTGSATCSRTRGYLDGEHGHRRTARRLARIWSESRPAGRRVPARRASGAGSGRPSWPPWCPRWSSRRAGERPGPPPRARGPVADALTAMQRLWAELHAEERRHGVPDTRDPDPGFAWPVLPLGRRGAPGPGARRRRVGRHRACRPATSCAGQAAHRPARPDRRRRPPQLAKVARAAVAKINRGVVAAADRHLTRPPDSAT